MQTITGNLEIIKRLHNSTNGNPRYCVRVGGVECYTAPDSMIAYSITNHRDKPITATIKQYYGKPTIQTITEGV